MPTLHLGEIDINYGFVSKGAGPTTGDVGTWLEKKYHVFEIFYQLHRQEIADALTESLSDALDFILMHQPVPSDVFAAGASKIEALFKHFLSSKEMDYLGYPGIPTQASLLGRSKRFKRGYGPVRPSFIDSGLYQASFKVWLS